MEFEDFYNLTPGQRRADALAVTSRPWHKDWANQQLTNLCDTVRANPWVVETIGRDVHVSVQVSPDSSMLVLVFERV